MPPHAVCLSPSSRTDILAQEALTESLLVLPSPPQVCSPRSQSPVTLVDGGDAQVQVAPEAGSRGGLGIATEGDTGSPGQRRRRAGRGGESFHDE